MCKLLLGKTEVELKWGTEEQTRSFTSQHDLRECALSLPGTVSTSLLGETDFILLPIRGSPAASENNHFLGVVSGAINDLLFSMGTRPVKPARLPLLNALTSL